MTNWQMSNPFIDSEPYSSAFKTLPLPDDNFGFDPTTHNSTTIATATLISKNPYNEHLNRMQSTQNHQNHNPNTHHQQQHQQQYQHQQQQMQQPPYQGSSNEDIESILFDLGISEPPPYSLYDLTPTQSNTQDAFAKRHNRKISGSAIFGFVGSGTDTQLAIPGIPSTSVTILNKKPLYQEIDRFDNIDFSKQHQPIFLDDDSIVNSSQIDQKISTINHQHAAVQPKAEKTQPDYYFTGDSDGRYKFPRTKAPSPIVNSYSAQDLRSLRHMHPGLEGYSSEVSTPKRTLTEKLTSLPTKEQQNVISEGEGQLYEDEIQEIDELLNYTTSRSSSNTPIMDYMSMQQQQQQKQTNDTIPETKFLPSTGSPAKNKAVVGTPFKVKNTFMELNTPTPQSTPSKLSWTPTLITKKNTFSEQIIKEQSLKSPTRKKKPTITSTLETGALDIHFTGPDEEDRYWCLFDDCGKPFTRISNIRAHIQTHLSDRPFTCDICKKAFVRNHDLRRHYKGHQEYTNICPCGKKFPRQDALKRHRIRNICKGGIPDENGLIKRKPAKSNIFKQTGLSVDNNNKKTKSKKLHPEVKDKLVNDLDNRVSQDPPLMSGDITLLTPIKRFTPPTTNIPTYNLQQSATKDNYFGYSSNLDFNNIEPDFSFSVDDYGAGQAA